MKKLAFSRVIPSEDIWKGSYTIKVYNEGYANHLYTIKLDYYLTPYDIVIEDKVETFKLDEFLALAKAIKSDAIFIEDKKDAN